jgi:hypothetical protein
MLKHYEVNTLTKGINLEWNTLRDWVEKPISHLGGLEIEELAMEGREMVSLEEEDLGEPPCLPEECSVTREGDLELWPPVRVREGERRKTTVGGLNTPEHVPSWILSGLTGHCPG